MRAIIYIADKDRYYAQAACSAESVRKFTPNVKIFLFTPKAHIDSPHFGKFDKVIPVAFQGQDRHNWYYKQTVYTIIACQDLIAMGIERALYLDCDTYACAPIADLFNLTTMFNFAGAQAPRRFTAKTADVVPDWFPEFNIGVNPMRIDAAMVDFWSAVAEEYDKNEERYGADDQHALRVTLWNYACSKPEFRVHTLPDEYNCRFCFPVSVGKVVKILHGIPAETNYENIRSIINEHPGAIRGWAEGLK